MQAAHRDFVVSEFGEASANHILSKTIGDDFKRAEYSSLPVTLVILLVAAIRKDLQEIMDANVQVFRTDETLRAALAEIEKLRERYDNVGIQDRGKRYNLGQLLGKGYQRGQLPAP